MIFGAAPFPLFYKRTYYNEYGYSLSPKHNKSPLGRYFFKAQGGMRAKPDMKPWVYTDKSGLSSVGAALTARVLGHLLWDCAAPTGLKNVYQCLTQGLRPGLCRSIALTGLIYVFPINILYYFDALALHARSVSSPIWQMMQFGYLWARNIT